jgi:DNA repair protein RadC
MHTISVDTLTASLVHPREVFAPAMEDRANSTIIAHNHPSGSLVIGDKDKDVTRRIRDAGKFMGIQLDDHIIVTNDSFVSAMQ